MKKLIAIAVALMVFTSGWALAEATVTAVGQGAVRVTPDCASVSLGVNRQEADVVEAQRLVNEQIASVRAALLEKGVKPADIATDSLNVYMQYDYSDNGETPNGYNVTHQLTVTVRDVNSVGAVIDAALAAGANQLYGVNFQLSDDTTAYKTALEAAVRNARERALVMAQAEDATLGGILSMTEGSNLYGEVYAMEAKNDAASGTAVDVGQMDVRATVTVVYEMTK